MANSVFVALWSNNNRATMGWSRSIAARIKRLDEMLELTQQWMGAHAAELRVSPEFKGIFLAPEYLFTQKSASNARDPMSESRRLQLEQSLLALSRKYPQILMVPGTIFYAKRLIRSQSKINKFDPATGLRTLPKTSDRDRRDRNLRQLGTYIANIPLPRAGSGDVDLRPWEQGGYFADPNVVPSLSEIRASMSDPAKAPWVVKNAAYILLGGRRIAKIDKQTDYGEAVGASPDDMAFLPGVFKQCPEVGGYRFGTEVCADHAYGMLARRNVAPMHFHLVISDSVQTALGNMTMSNGGYFAHASTDYAQSCLYRRTELGALDNISENAAYWKETGGMMASNLDGYVVPLPAPLSPPLPPRNVLNRL